MFQWMDWDITCKPLFGGKYDLTGHKDSTRQSTFESTFKGVLQMLRCAKYPPRTKVVETLKLKMSLENICYRKREGLLKSHTMFSTFLLHRGLGQSFYQAHRSGTIKPTFWHLSKSTTWVDKTATKGRTLGLTSSRSDSSRPILGLHSSCAQSLPHTPETNSSHQAWGLPSLARIDSTIPSKNLMKNHHPRSYMNLNASSWKYRRWCDVTSSHFALALLGYLEVPLWIIVFLGSQPICLPQHLCISDGLEAVIFPKFRTLTFETPRFGHGQHQAPKQPRHHTAWRQEETRL